MGGKGGVGECSKQKTKVRGILASRLCLEAGRSRPMKWPGLGPHGAAQGRGPTTHAPHPLGCRAGRWAARGGGGCRLADTGAPAARPRDKASRDKGAANTCRSWRGRRFSPPKRLQLPTVTGIKLRGPDGGLREPGGWRAGRGKGYRRGTGRGDEGGWGKGGRGEPTRVRTKEGWAVAGNQGKAGWGGGEGDRGRVASGRGGKGK